MAYNENDIKNKYRGTLATNIVTGNISAINSLSSEELRYTPTPFMELKEAGVINRIDSLIRNFESQFEPYKETPYNDLPKNIQKLFNEMNQLKRGYLPERDIKNIQRNTAEYTFYSLHNIINSFNGKNYASSQDLINENGVYSFKSLADYKEGLTNRKLRFAGLSEDIFNSESMKRYIDVTGVSDYKEFNKKFGIAFISDEGYTSDTPYVYGEHYKNIFENKEFKRHEEIYFNLKDKKNLSIEENKAFKEAKDFINKTRRDNYRSEKTFAFLQREDGTFAVSEAKINYSFMANNNTKEFIPTYEIKSLSPTEMSLGFINETPFIPGITNVADYSSGFTDTTSAGPLNTAVRTLIQELSLNKTMALASDEDSIAAKSVFLQQREKIRGGLRIFEDSHRFNLGDSADANWTNTFQLKFNKYDVTQTGPKYESNQYLLSSTMFKNLFFPDKEDNMKKFMEQVKWELKDPSRIVDYQKMFNDSVFSVSINSEDKITGVTVLNKSLGLVKNSTAGVVHLGDSTKDLLSNMNELNTKALTIKLKSREELIKRFAYAELSGGYTANYFKSQKGPVRNSIDYYNSKMASLGLLNNKDEKYSQINAFQNFYAERIEDVDRQGNERAYKMISNNFNFKRKQMQEFDKLVSDTVKDINYGFIRREELEMYTGVKFNKNDSNSDPTSYLQMALREDFKLDPRLRRRIENQLELVNENMMRAFYSTGENIYLAGNVGKQGANAAGKLNFLESFNHPLAFIDGPSQRKSQGVDDFGALKINGLNVNAITGDAFSSINGMGHHNTFLINQSKLGIRESLEKAYVNNFLTKSLTDEEYKKYISGDRSEVKFQKLEEALAFQLNGLHANDQHTAPVKLLHANTLGSWQDSNLLAESAKLKMVNSPDTLRNISIDINSINYQRIQKLNGDYYSDKLEFLDDWKYYSLQNAVGSKRLELEDVMFDETSKFGNIIKQILGSDYDKIKLQRTNSMSITDSLQAAANDFKMDIATSDGSLEAEAEAINRYAKIQRKLLKDNLIIFNNGKGSIGDSSIIGNFGTVNKANMGYVSGIDVKDNLLNIQLSKVVLGGSGGKAMMDSIKLTENGMNADMILFNVNGIDIRIDGIVNPKAGKIKRSFNGAMLNSIMNTMTINAINTPLAGESQVKDSASMTRRLKSLQENIFDAPIFKMATTDNKMVDMSLSQLFGLEYGVNQKTGTVEVRSRFYDEAEKEFSRQINRGTDFMNTSLENFVVQKFYNNAKKLGLDMSQNQMEIFSPYLLERLSTVYEDYVSTHMDSKFSSNARIFIRGGGTIKSSVIGANGKAEFRNFETVTDDLAMILFSNLNGMDDSISQKEANALLASTSFLNIARQQGMFNLEKALMEKSTMEKDVVKYKQAVNRFSNEGQRTLGLQNLIDYRGYTIDGTELEKYKVYADSKILKDDFVTGNYFLSDILEFDDKGTTNNIKAFGSSMKYDKFGRAINLGSSLSSENKRLNDELMNIIKLHVFDKNDNLVSEFQSNFTDEQLITLNSHIKTFLTDGDKEAFLKNYASDLISFHYDNTFEDIWLSNDKKFSNKDKYKLLLKKGKEFHLRKLENGLSGLELNEDEGDFINLLGIRVNYLSKLAGSKNNFASEKIYKNILTSEIYGDKIDFIEDVIKNGFAESQLGNNRELFFFDLNRISLSDDGRFVFNSNFENVNKYARYSSEYNSLIQAKNLLDDEVFVNTISTRNRNSEGAIELLSNLAKNDTERENLAKGLIQSTDSKSKYKNIDFDFNNFMENNFYRVNEGYTEAELIKTRTADGRILLTDSIEKVIGKARTGVYMNDKTTAVYGNPFEFIKNIDEEIKIAKQFKDKDKWQSDRYEVLMQIRNEVKNEYINKVLKNKVSNALLTGSTDNELISEMFGVFASKDFLSKKGLINARINYLEKTLENFKLDGELSVFDFVETLEKTDDTKYVNSLNVTPSEATALNNFFKSWIDGSTTTPGQTKGARSLFFNELGEFRDEADFRRELFNFNDLGKRIYGGYIDFNTLENNINQAREMIKNGSTPEEVREFLSKYTNSISDDLDSIVGLTLVSNKHFKQLTKNALLDSKSKTAFIQLVRNPTIYQTSILHSKLVSISQRDIEKGTFLSGIFGTGNFDDVDRITTYNIGKLTQLVMNGDYDGDKIYAALLGMRDTLDKNLLRSVYGETMLDNAIMNELTHKRNPFDSLNDYSFGNKLNKDGSHMLWSALDEILTYDDKMKYIRNMSPDEQVKELKKIYSTKIFGYRNAIQMMTLKLEDELEDASKTLHIPEFKLTVESGEAKIAKNSMIFNLFNLIQGNERGEISSIDDDRLSEYFEAAKKHEPFYNHITDDDKEVLDALIKNPKKAKEIFEKIFEDKNKNKSLRIMLSQFGEETNFRSYADNIKTGTASYELANVGRLARLLSNTDGYDSFYKELTGIKKGLYNFSISEKDFIYSISRLATSDLFGILPEKAISSKHDTDTAEALITSHKTVKNILSEIIRQSSDTASFKNASDMYTEFIQANTIEDLKKLNFMKYLENFGSLNSSGNTIENKRKLLFNLLNLTGDASEETTNILNMFSSDKDLTFDQVLSLLAKDRDEFLNSTGEIDINIKENALRIFGHMNEILMENFGIKYFNQLDEILEKDKIDVYTVKSIFRNLDYSNVKERFDVLTGKKGKIAFHGVINGWVHWFKDFKTVEEKKADGSYKEEVNETKNKIETSKNKIKEEAKASKGLEGVDPDGSKPQSEAEIKEEAKTNNEKQTVASTEKEVLEKQAGVKTNVETKTIKEGDEVMFYGSSTYKKWEKQNQIDQALGLADIDKEYNKELKDLKDKYKTLKKGKTKEEREILENKYSKDLEELVKKREDEIENLKGKIFSKYQDEVQIDYQNKLKEDQIKIESWRNKGLDPIDMLQREIHKEKLNAFKEKLDEQDLTDYNRRSLIYNEGKRIKAQDRIDAEERVKNADENKITRTQIDKIENDYNEKARSYRAKNIQQQEVVSETFSNNPNISSNTANEVINENKSDTESIQSLIEQYEKSNKREKSGIKKQLYKRFGKTINELTEENKELKNKVDEINSKDTDNIVDEVTDTVSEKNINDTAETIQETVGETVEKAKTTVDETIENTAKAASKAGEKIKEAFKGKKAKTGLAIGIGVALIGGFVNLLNKNRTVVHLETNDQINQQPQQGGGYGTITPTDNLQRRMGNYKIYTNIRDTF